jgi:hypothetical protein
MTTEKTIEEIALECLKYVKADTARISKPLETMYLIIGFNKNTRDCGEGFWTDQHGKRIDFNYVKEHVIASGRTPKELYKSVKEYRRLCGLNMEEYLRERLKAS